ncbi:MAG: dnaG [Ramlibacter sp.]|nr:dnaG [Ramlibacter sp.]
MHALLGRLDCVEIVGCFVQLKKAGHDFAGLCPFHSEKSPSFTVSPTKQFYHCFGCGKNGDAIRFVQEMQGLDFREAVEELARQMAMPLPDSAQEDPDAARERARAAQARTACVQAQDAAAGFFAHALQGSARALQYLQGRELPLAQLQERYLIGYAPAQWDSLRSVFPDYERSAALLASGLVIDDEERSRRHDRFRDRVMFGIRNLKGEVVAFGGRLLGDGKPKYLNSPDSPAFDKSRELYGLFEARQAIQAAGHTLVCEGYVDVLSLAGCGIGQSVATMGTACTHEQLRVLLRLAPGVIFCFDGDEAGRKAAWRALRNALPLATDSSEFRFLLLPGDMDPDEIVKTRGRAAFDTLLANAIPLSQYLVDVLRDRHNGPSSIEDRARFSKEADELLALMPPSRFAQLLREQVNACVAVQGASMDPAAGPAAPAVPRVAQRPAIPGWASNPAAKTIQALADAIRSQAATAQELANHLVAQLDGAGQRSFFDGNLDGLDEFERPMWAALNEVCHLTEARDSQSDTSTAQRDLLQAAPAALARARAANRRRLLISGLRQGTVEPGEFARAALQQENQGPEGASAAPSD